MRLEFQGLNTNKFHDELVAAGINPVVTSSENKTWIDFPNIVKQAEGTEEEPITVYKAIVVRPSIENPEEMGIEYEPFDWPALEAQIQALSAAHNPQPRPQPKTQDKIIAELQAKLVFAEQRASENNRNLMEFMDFYFSVNPELA